MTKAGSVGGELRQGEVFGGSGAAARGLFECGFAAVSRIIGLFTVENLLDGEDLQAGIDCAVEGSALVEACLGGFVLPRKGGAVKGQENADLSGIGVVRTFLDAKCKNWAPA